MTGPASAAAGATLAAPSDPDLFALLQRLADNKYWLGRRYAEWCTGAPTLEAAVAAAAMAQDEIGHARSHYPLFRQFVGRDVEPETREPFSNLASLDQPFNGWIDFVAANFLVDSALTTLFESATESTYDDLRNRARRIVGEEQVHWLHGRAWVRRLASQSTAMRESLEGSLSQKWTELLMWFGPTRAAGADTLYERGILASEPDELRMLFDRRIQPVLSEAGLQSLSTDASTLPWARWDGQRYRLDPSE